MLHFIQAQSWHSHSLTLNRTSCRLSTIDLLIVSNAAFLSWHITEYHYSLRSTTIWILLRFVQGVNKNRNNKFLNDLLSGLKEVMRVTLGILGFGAHWFYEFCTKVKCLTVANWLQSNACLWDENSLYETRAGRYIKFSQYIHDDHDDFAGNIKIRSTVNHNVMCFSFSHYVFLNTVILKYESV